MYYTSTERIYHGNECQFWVIIKVRENQTHGDDNILVVTRIMILDCTCLHSIIAYYQMEVPLLTSDVLITLCEINTFQSNTYVTDYVLFTSMATKRILTWQDFDTFIQLSFPTLVFVIVTNRNWHQNGITIIQYTLFF